ncbi:LPS assembly lipoprotein LptE [Photobacterium halotolerans]|uniref:LPS-assembly lipoprotein LptE n=1 Tax=Photobacterium halotolerans TaxID=265726 RepID=UPI003B20C0B4
MSAASSLLSRFRLIFVVVLALATASCGFHLRGNYMLPDDIARLSLTSFDKYGPLTRMVQSQFKLHGIEAVPPSSQVPNLHLISESQGSRTLSLYQNSRAAEYELTYTVSYQVVVPEKGAKRFTTKVNRSFLDNPLTALAKSVERDMLLNEMRQQASRQIMRQLARLTADLNQSDSDDADLPASDTHGSVTTIETETDADRQAADQMFDTRDSTAQ